MRNKIMIMALLCALLVGVSTPRVTKAEEDDGKYRTTYYGLDYVFNPETLTLTRENDDEQFVFDEQFRPYFDAKYNWMIVAYGDVDDGFIQLCVVDPMYDFAVVIGSTSSGEKKMITSYRTMFSNTSPIYHQVFNGDTGSTAVKFKECTAYKILDSEITYYYTYKTNEKVFVLFSNKDVQCIKTKPTESLWVYPWYRSGEYAFAEFCDDVGIANNLGVYEQNGNDVYIVQESRGEYPYRLLQFRYKISSLYFPYYYTNDVSSYIGISNPSETAQSVTVYEYGYSADTGAWVKINEKVGPVAYGAPIVELLDIYNGKIVYANYDIYDGTTLQTVKYRATEKAVEPVEPSVTPTVPPSSGGSVSPLPTVAPPISAGQATVTKNRTAIYEEPSSTSQVQHYLFEGGVVYVVEEYGEDWYFVRYDMGGLSYTGYVAKDNVNYDVDNGFASEDVIDGYEGQVDDLLGMVGNVPKMIYALFSFLPPWCLALVGVSFTAMLALIGWKILRG